MDASSGRKDRNLLENVLVPVASKKDATRTAAALADYEPEHVTAVHVIEKGEGVPDKTPVSQSKEIAAESYAAVRTVFPDASEHTAYGRNVVETIFEAAAEVDASAIAFRSRGGNRLLQFISGDRSLKLVTGADRPVIALPAVDE